MEGQIWEVIKSVAGSGAIVTILVVIKWIYEKARKKSKTNWKEASDIRDELKDSRDYWKGLAEQRGDEIDKLKVEVKEREEEVAKLEKELRELEIRINKLEEQA